MVAQAEVTAINHALAALKASARAHKQAEFRSRQEAREAMQQHDRLLAYCHAVGINVVTDKESQTDVTGNPRT